MIVDEDRNYAITNYTQIPRGGKAVDSDHMTTLARIKLNIVPHKIQQETVYNLKNINAQKQFKSITSSTKDFSTSITNNNSVQVKYDMWKVVLDSHVKHAFKKLRVRKPKIKSSEVDNLIRKRNKLKRTKKPSTFMLDNHESQISKLLIQDGVSKSHQFRKYCDLKSTLPLQQLWKLKNKLWPKKAPALPMAKYNHKGRLVTTPHEIMNVLRKEFKDRLRPRKTKAILSNHMRNAHEVTRLKLELAWKNKSAPFSKSEFEKFIQDLKIGKARDPLGLCAEMLKPEAMGSDMKQSLLEMLNNIKEEGKIPDVMREAVITAIPKSGSGSKFKLENERGILNSAYLEVFFSD